MDDGNVGLTGRCWAGWPLSPFGVVGPLLHFSQSRCTETTGNCGRSSKLLLLNPRRRLVSLAIYKLQSHGHVVPPREPPYRQA